MTCPVALRVRNAGKPAQIPGAWLASHVSLSMDFPNKPAAPTWPGLGGLDVAVPWLGMRFKKKKKRACLPECRNHVEIARAGGGLQGRTFLH